MFNVQSNYGGWHDIMSGLTRTYAIHTANMHINSARPHERFRVLDETNKIVFETKSSHQLQNMRRYA